MVLHFQSQNNIVLKPSPARLVDSRLELNRVEKKIKEEKTQYNSATFGKTQLKTQLQPVDFEFFLLNNVVLILKKI